MMEHKALHFSNVSLSATKASWEQYWNVESRWPILVWSKVPEHHGDWKSIRHNGVTIPLHLYAIGRIFINCYGIQVGVNLGDEVIDVEAHRLSVCFAMPDQVQLPDDYVSNGHTLASDTNLVEGKNFIVLHQANQASKLHYVKSQLTWEI
jgi:hypothetical protein